jgi:hypothetical protein
LPRSNACSTSSPVKSDLKPITCAGSGGDGATALAPVGSTTAPAYADKSGKRDAIKSAAALLGRRVDSVVVAGEFGTVTLTADTPVAGYKGFSTCSARLYHKHQRSATWIDRKIQTGTSFHPAQTCG